MTVAIVAGVLGLIAVLVAYYRDAPGKEQGVVAPAWDLLPDPSDVARTEFPMAVPGYEPATVEMHFDLLTRAYADLLASAPPEVIARARHRAAVRQGIEPPEEPQETRAAPAPAAVAAPPLPPRRSTLAPLSSEGADAEALRAEAALADLDGAHTRTEHPR